LGDDHIFGYKTKQTSRLGDQDLKKVLIFLLSFVVTSAIWHGAFAAVGIRALDEPALMVKAPDKVLLIAIARAGNRLVAVGEHGVITYSDDNGVSWRQSDVPVTVSLTSVGFADALHGWAAGHYGVILHTSDGGVTWQEQLNGLQANQLTLSAAQAAVADHNASPGAPLAVRRADAFIAGGADKPFLSILATSDNDVTVFGAYRMVMKTTDGGKTWVDWSLNIADPISQNLYDAERAGQEIYIASEAGLVFLSTDGGNIYNQVTPPTDSTLFGILALGSGNVLTYGVAGRMFASSDAGKTWQTIDLGTDTNLTAAIKLASGKIVLAAEDGRVFVSDGAVTAF
jgi:photosystem II stability/assembly factor-like uncharacterized protein